MIGIGLLVIFLMSIQFPLGNAANFSNNNRNQINNNVPKCSSTTLSNNSNNPFQFEVNMIYNANLSLATGTYYCQMYLNSSTLYYLRFPITSGLDVQLYEANNSLSQIFNYYHQEESSFYTIFETNDSGLYNLTITSTNTVGGSTLLEIGYFQIHELTLNESYNFYANFGSLNNFCIAYYNFKDITYKMNDINTISFPCYYHLFNSQLNESSTLNKTSQYCNLNPNVDYYFNENGENTTINASGTYIVYTFTTTINSISEVNQQTASKNKISGFNIEILLLIGVFSIGAIVFNKKLYRIKGF